MEGWRGREVTYSSRGQHRLGPWRGDAARGHSSPVSRRVSFGKSENSPHKVPLAGLLALSLLQHKVVTCWLRKVDLQVLYPPRLVLTKLNTCLRKIPAKKLRIEANTTKLEHK